MTVWVVFRVYDDLEIVNDRLEIMNLDAFEIMGIYRDEIEAASVCNQYQCEADTDFENGEEVNYHFDFAEYPLL